MPESIELTDAERKAIVGEYGPAVAAKLRWLDPERHSDEPTRYQIAQKFYKLALDLAGFYLTESDQLIIALQRLIDAKDAAIRAAILKLEGEAAA